MVGQYQKPPWYNPVTQNTEGWQPTQSDILTKWTIRMGQV